MITCWECMMHVSWLFTTHQKTKGFPAKKIPVGDNYRHPWFQKFVFPLWLNNHFGNTKVPLLTGSTSLFRALQPTAAMHWSSWHAGIDIIKKMIFPFCQNNDFGNTSCPLFSLASGVFWDTQDRPGLMCLMATESVTRFFWKKHQNSHDN